jgi:hypothetical protein
MQITSNGQLKGTVGLMGLIWLCQLDVRKSYYDVTSCSRDEKRESPVCRGISDLLSDGGSVALQCDGCARRRPLPDEADQFATQCIEEKALQESPFQQHNAPRDIYLLCRLGSKLLSGVFLPHQ